MPEHLGLNSCGAEWQNIFEMAHPPPYLCRIFAKNQSFISNKA